jgi:isoleucyl-tRNA synthetase
MSAHSDNQKQYDYRKTLHITLSDRDPGAFPQRGNLPTREPEFQRRWAEQSIYAKSLQKPAPKGTFVLHDGPPYSNGNIHLGHALNKIAKDITTRFRTMDGYRAPYVPGWDNHGMPIENAVARRFREEAKTTGGERPETDRLALRRACREYAQHWIEVQREQFKRLGVRGDWEHPYLTMEAKFEAKLVEVFGELVEQGYIYRGLKPVLWCAVCETALADAEVEYEPHVSHSIYVRFPVREDPNGVFPNQTEHPAYVLIWTTTPWTIPANLALAVHPDAEYVVVSAEIGAERAFYLVAQPLLETTMGLLHAAEFTPVKTLRGSELVGLIATHPLFDRPSPVVLANYVTMDTGTGIVHTAPGHGKEDFETGKQYGLEVLNPVDPSGRYTQEAGGYAGRSFAGLRVVPEPGETEAPANLAVIEALRHAGHLMSAGKYEHSYPHCWRCHSPLIFRATVQWFMNIDHNGFRQKALEAIQKVTWYPKESINRITSMVANRPDWCLSRQRSWGVGIPAFYCDACGETILTKESIGAVADLVRRENSDAWYRRTPAEILPPNFVCPKCGAGVEHLRKETDVLDVWFDSGCTHRAVLESGEWPELHWPAELYLEGGDQHRGWFNSSLMIAVATKGQAPYRAVVTNGWTLDENGEAMHKSKGNVVDPMEVVQRYGADVVRWWVVSQDFMEDTRCGEHLLAQVSEMYRRVRNTFRFLLNNLYDFDPTTDAIPLEQMEELDRWALSRLAQVVAACHSAYEQYAFHRVYQTVIHFCTVDLSAFYLDVLKDRLYASGKTWPARRSAQTALHQLASTLARVLAPILPHTMEEVWDHLKMEAKPESVHLADYPQAGCVDEELLKTYTQLLEVREAVLAGLEAAKQSGRITNPLESLVRLRADATYYPTLAARKGSLASLFIVSQVVLEEMEDGEESAGTKGLQVEVEPAPGKKCARCWLVLPDVGIHADHPLLCTRCVQAVSSALPIEG